MTPGIICEVVRAGKETLRAGVQVLRDQAAGEEMEALLGLFASFVMDLEQTCTEPVEVYDRS